MKRVGLFICIALLSVPGSLFAQATDSFTISQLYGSDTELPTTPTPFAVSPTSPTQIDVTWGASTDNSAVAAYQLFRDGAQIATTTALSYIDTGLTASTTYSYYVRALDLFGNQSVPSATLATTTFDYPPVVATSTPTSSSPVSSTVLPPRLQSIQIDPGVFNAWVTFLTQQPVTYTLRYGTDETLTTGFVQSDVFKKEHSTVLTDLQPQTTYFYALIATDRYGRERRLSEGQFTTLSEYITQVVPNVRAFDAYAVAGGVSLIWENPAFADFRYVRVVRSHYWYPQDPHNGFVVYEGPADSFYDTGAFTTADTEYYTIYTYAADGRVSSGAVTRVRALGAPALPPEAVPEPASVASTTDTLPATPEPAAPTLSLGDVQVIQSGIAVEAVAGVYPVVAATPFMIQMPARAIPNGGYTLFAHYAYPLPTMRQVQYFFHPIVGAADTLESSAVFTDLGQYDVTLKLTNAEGVTVATLPLVLMVSEDAAAGSSVIPDSRSVLAAYVLLGGLVGLVVILMLRWLLLVLFRLFRRG